MKTRFFFIFLISFLTLYSLLNFLHTPKTQAHPIPVTHPSSPDSLTYLNQIGGSNYSSAFQNNYLYAAIGPRLITFNAQDPSDLQLTSQSDPFTSTIFFVEATSTHVYILNQQALVVFDLSNPATPVQIGMSIYNDSPSGLFLTGNYLYASFNSGADATGGLRIFDISNPANPQQITFYDLPNESVNDVSIQGNYAYLAIGGSPVRLEILDVSNPANPTVANSINMFGASGLDIAGNYLYWVNGDDIEVYLMNSPTSLTLVGGLNTPGQAEDIWAVGNRAYVVDGVAGVQIVDVTNPVTISILGVFDLPGAVSNPYAVEIVNNHAFIAYLADGLRVVDISNVTNPPELTFFKLFSYLNGVESTPGFLYTTDLNKLNIWDVSNPLSPNLVGSYQTPTFIAELIVRGGYAYLSQYFGADLTILDISNPTTPTFVSSLNLPGNSSSLTVEGNFIYHSKGSDGIQIVDISNPTMPVALGSFNTAGSVYGQVAISGSYAFLPDSYNGLVVLDVSQPTAPILVTTYDPFQGAVDSVLYINSYLYVGAATDGIYVLDISNPAMPVSMGLYGLDGNIGLGWEGGSLFAHLGPIGIQALDISNPISPTLTGSFNTSGSVTDQTSLLGVIFVADTFGGLWILEDTFTAPPLIAIDDTTLYEGNSGATAAAFTMTLSITSTEPVTVSYTTVNGTAEAGSDYEVTSGVIQFTPGMMTQVVTVNIYGDAVVEPDETFFLILNNPLNGTIMDNSGLGSILNDDQTANQGIYLPLLSRP